MGNMAFWFSFLKRAKPQTAAATSGAWGEAEAAKLLQKKRYRILGRNVRLGPRCELDIVASDVRRNVLVFVEVKTRKNEDFGRPILAVNRDKRKALSRAAIRYIRKNKVASGYIRFDVVEVMGEPGRCAHMIHTENAFPLESEYRLPW